VLSRVASPNPLLRRGVELTFIGRKCTNRTHAPPTPQIKGYGSSLRKKLCLLEAAQVQEIRYNKSRSPRKRITDTTTSNGEQEDEDESGAQCRMEGRV
jgi:hypothetical protein